MKSTIKILFLAANPKDTGHLRLDEEIREIDEALRRTKYREKFVLEAQWAVRVADLQTHFLRYEPDIVHFSGHGSQKSEIILEDKDGSSQPVSIRALSALFSILKDNIRCVVLNACYSEPQARAIAGTIDCVIGMSVAIGDESAILFSSAFYQALGFGRNVKTAFDLACNQIDLGSLNEQDTPKLLFNNKKPEEIFLLQSI
jgi:CHAT domain-containing protein